MPGEVVYDSIIQNKSKIKSYWEQLMLAAELASQSSPSTKGQHHFHHVQVHHVSPAAAAPAPTAPAPTTHHVVAQEVHSPDLSDTEFYDALSHVSPDQSPDLESLKTTETVVERDIRLQQERELALADERQKALKSVKDKAAVAKITTGVKDKEEELQRQMGSSAQQPDEAYLSIPTTDEGNFSEYGSEDKEDPSPDGSRVMSPVGPAGISSHQRTQSLDSMSSGHSSGSGTASHPDLSLPKTERRQTFGPVKPLDEPEDVDLITYVKYEKETPIEREIRLAREREEELRREKRISSTPLAPPMPTSPRTVSTQDFEKKKEAPPRVASPRVSTATQRVQQEIELATEREKELKRWSSDDLQKDGSTNLLLKPERKMKPPQLLQNGDAMKDSVELPKTLTSAKNGGASPKIYIQNPQQKGLMKRFLASRGKMSTSPRLSTVSTPPSATLPPVKTPTLSPSSLLSEPFFSFTSLVQTKEREESVTLGTRPGYKSAEDKIQSELREMKKREDELRQQRRSSLYSARSQPDLLNIDNDSMTEQEINFTETEEEQLTRLPNTSKLRSALSVQNLLDIDDKRAPRRVGPKKKSALIEQWESRIQNKN